MLPQLVENRNWRQWADKTNVAEVEGDMWFEPMRTFVKEVYDGVD